MKSTVLVVLAVLAGLVSQAASPAEMPSEPVKAAVSVELKDAAGDMDPISTSEGSEPALDVVMLAIGSDGSQITLAATLNDPPGSFADAPVVFYIDTDNSEATGAKGRSGKPGGFEYKAKLAMCIDYSDGSSACAGGSAKSKPTARWGAIDLERFKGDSEFGEKETILDSMGFPGTKASRKVPVAGKIVQCSLDYADLQVKSGQTIRLFAREAAGSPKEGDGDFPIVLLTLK